MPLTLKKDEISSSGGAIRRTRSDVPDYLKRAISESVERGKQDARRNVFVADRREKSTDTSK